MITRELGHLIASAEAGRLNLDAPDHLTTTRTPGRPATALLGWELPGLSCPAVGAEGVELRAAVTPALEPITLALTAGGATFWSTTYEAKPAWAELTTVALVSELIAWTSETLRTSEGWRYAVAGLLEAGTLASDHLAARGEPDQT